MVCTCLLNTVGIDLPVLPSFAYSLLALFSFLCFARIAFLCIAWPVSLIANSSFLLYHSYPMRNRELEQQLELTPLQQPHCFYRQIYIVLALGLLSKLTRCLIFALPFPPYSLSFVSNCSILYTGPTIIGKNPTIIGFTLYGWGSLWKFSSLSKQAWYLPFYLHQERRGPYTFWFIIPICALSPSAHLLLSMTEGENNPTTP